MDKFSKWKESGPSRKVPNTDPKGDKPDEDIFIVYENILKPAQSAPEQIRNAFEAPPKAVQAAVEAPFEAPQKAIETSPPRSFEAPAYRNMLPDGRTAIDPSFYERNQERERRRATEDPPVQAPSRAFGAPPRALDVPSRAFEAPPREFEAPVHRNMLSGGQTGEDPSVYDRERRATEEYGSSQYRHAEQHHLQHVEQHRPRYENGPAPRYGPSSSEYKDPYYRRSSHSTNSTRQRPRRKTFGQMSGRSHIDGDYEGSPSRSPSPPVVDRHGSPLYPPKRTPSPKNEAVERHPQLEDRERHRSPQWESTSPTYFDEDVGPSRSGDEEDGSPSPPPYEPEPTSPTYSDPSDEKDREQEQRRVGQEEEQADREEVHHNGAEHYGAPPSLLRAQFEEARAQYEYDSQNAGGIRVNRQNSSIGRKQKMVAPKRGMNWAESRYEGAKK